MSQVQKIKIIAEAGVNHNGDMALAGELIVKAAEVGADYIKFQAFSPEHLVVTGTPKALYQARQTGNGEDQLEMLRKLSLDIHQLAQLKALAKENSIGFVCSVFDLPSLEGLISLRENIIKIPSGEIDHFPLLQAIGKMNAEVWLSTGMSVPDEIRTAIEILTGSGTHPGNIILMHCHTQYPTPANRANLRAISTLREIFGLPIGYSDHTSGITCALAAAALGAVLIEKHFTLNSSLPGPDHAASLEPTDFRQMVEGIREIESALGSGERKPSDQELENKPLVRKGIYASRNISEGETLNEENLVCLRPTGNLSAAQWPRIIFTKARRDYIKHEAIDEA